MTNVIELISPVQIIARLNDNFRRDFIGGRVMLTDGIANLSARERNAILRTVQTFNSFTEDNDPHGEHDFGSFDSASGEKVFWKIDYYDSKLEYGSENPANPNQTTRVLTIMLASEY